MVKNIVIGQKIFITKLVLKYLKIPIVFLANELTKKKFKNRLIIIKK